ncbi:MAG: deaminase [Candidatus Paceibacterota bacterium]
MKRISKEKTFFKIAEVLKDRSTCLMAKVGCVITDSEMINIISIGYNGNYSGGPNHCDQEVEKGCNCVHAEINAITKAEKSLKNAVLFSTHEPCLMCSKSIINSGIKKVFFYKNYSYSEGSDIMKKAGITVERISTND